MAYTDTHCSETRHSSRTGISLLLGKALAFAHFFIRCLEVAAQRRQLKNLDASAMRDIGLSHSEVNREANRGFWDIADERRRPARK